MVTKADNELKVTITVDNEQAMKAIAEVQEALKPFVWLGIVQELASLSDESLLVYDGGGPERCVLCESRIEIDEPHKPDCLLIRARKAVGE